MIKKYEVSATVEVIVKKEIVAVDPDDAWGLLIEQFNDISREMSDDVVYFNGITGSKIREIE